MPRRLHVDIAKRSRSNFGRKLPSFLLSVAELLHVCTKSIHVSISRDDAYVQAARCLSLYLSAPAKKTSISK